MRRLFAGFTLHTIRGPLAFLAGIQFLNGTIAILRKDPMWWQKSIAWSIYGTLTLIAHLLVRVVIVLEARHTTEVDDDEERSDAYPA